MIPTRFSPSITRREPVCAFHMRAAASARESSAASVTVALVMISEIFMALHPLLDRLPFLSARTNVFTLWSDDPVVCVLLPYVRRPARYPRSSEDRCE